MKINPRFIACLTLLIHWGPSNALSYGWGFLMFMFLPVVRPDWFRFRGKYSRKIATYGFLFATVFLLSALVNAFGKGASVNNLFWSIVTYGSTLCSLFVLIILPYRENDGPSIFRFSLYLTIFEGLVGYIQMLAAQSFQSMNPFTVLGPAAGDYFVGTTFDPGIGNYVAIKMSITVLLFVPFWFTDRNLKNSVILFSLLIGWILPSAIYTLLIGFLVIVIYIVFNESLRSIFTLRLEKTVFYAVIAGMFLVVIFFYTQQDNVSYAYESLKQVYGTAFNPGSTQSSGKVIYVKEALTKLPVEYPYEAILGVGPGNYSSRSAWLVSGEYLEHQPEYIPVTPSLVARKYLIPLWSRKQITVDNKGAGSITNQPFSTWLSILTEMGIIGLFSFFMMMRFMYAAFWQAEIQLKHSFYSKLALGLKMTFIYIVLLFLVDNLFEWPLVMAQFFVFASILIRQLENKITRDRDG